ncbi:MAG: hypothetical protein LUC91_00045, partial [Prevotella sp.]|nr:hypothetical protein [Prevotella sp.]
KKIIKFKNYYCSFLLFLHLDRGNSFQTFYMKRFSYILGLKFAKIYAQGTAVEKCSCLPYPPLRQRLIYRQGVGWTVYCARAFGDASIQIN